MLKRLQARVFRVDADAGFHAAFMDYYNRREEFSPEAMSLADWSEMAKKSVSHPCLHSELEIIDSEL